MGASPRPIKITEVVLRDAHQSLLATRMRTEDMLPIAEKLDQVGYFSLEMWGGATFDSCIRFLNEDPWDRLRKLKQKMPNTPFQMLLRGQNCVGYRHYADDIVERFVKHSADEGMDIFRIFDALNDFRNIATAISTAKKCNKIVEGTISYTVSPVHRLELFVQMAIQLEDMGSDILCIKDMAGLLTPKVTFDLITEIKKNIKLPIHLHTHSTTGLAGMNIQCAIDAGVDMVDTAISSLSMGTSHYPTESLVAALQGTVHDTGLDLGILEEIADYLYQLGIAQPKEFFDVIQKKADWWDNYDFLISRPRSADLEGYLFPDTYRVFRDASIKEIVQKMLDNFDNKISDELMVEIKRQGKTVHDILTLAAIIEKEVVGDKDRKIVADIFYKRLDAGMALQADSTVNYDSGASNARSSAKDLEIDSPYNTYKYRGLPPGPIANPGLSSILAAIYPETNPYWYFLTTPDGEAVYNVTFEEHVEDKNKYY
ncbi:MAG: endolytic transglycosylase MltG [Nitrospinae bacterium]|nr:endolytic transglycosylase MltG [Nitrospinota bacterium]